MSLAGAWAGLARALKVFAVSEDAQLFCVWSTVLPPTRWNLKNNQLIRWVTIWNPGLSEQKTLLESKEPTQVWLGSCHRKDFGQKMRWGVISISNIFFLFMSFESSSTFPHYTGFGSNPKEEFYSWKHLWILHRLWWTKLCHDGWSKSRKYFCSLCFQDNIKNEKLNIYSRTWCTHFCRTLKDFFKACHLQRLKYFVCMAARCEWSSHG